MEVEVHHPANADHERRLAPPDHRTVEDHRDIGAHPRPASTHSTIESPPISSSPSNAKRTLTGSAPFACELPHGLDEHEHVPLVVGDAAGVQSVRRDA